MLAQEKRRVGRRPLRFVPICQTRTQYLHAAQDQLHCQFRRLPGCLHVSIEPVRRASVWLIPLLRRASDGLAAGWDKVVCAN